MSDYKRIRSRENEHLPHIRDCGEEPPPNRDIPSSCCHGCERDADGICTHEMLLDSRYANAPLALKSWPFYETSSRPDFVPSWCPDAKIRLRLAQHRRE